MHKLNTFDIFNHYDEKDVTPYEIISNIDICGSAYGLGRGASPFDNKFNKERLDGSGYTLSIEIVHSYSAPATTCYYDTKNETTYIEKSDGQCVFIVSDH